MSELKRLEDKILEYEVEFDELKAIDKPATRYDKLTQLFKRYAHDEDLIRLAMIYSRGSWRKSHDEKLRKLLDIRKNIFKEIREYEKPLQNFDNERDRFNYVSSRISELKREGPLSRIANGYFAKKHGVSSDLLNKRITID